jgi:hypothetical protein
VLLNLVCKYFIKIFASVFVKVLAYNFLFLCVSLSDFGIRVILTSWNECGSVPSFSSSLGSIGISSLKVW